MDLFCILFDFVVNVVFLLVNYSIRAVMRTVVPPISVTINEASLANLENIDTRMAVRNPQIAALLLLGF